MLVTQASNSSSSDSSVEGELPLSPKKKRTLKEKTKLLPPSAEEAKQKMKAGVTNEKVCGSSLTPPPIEPCSVKLQPKVQTRKLKPHSK